jgi:hypothetical protein
MARAGPYMVGGACPLRQLQDLAQMPTDTKIFLTMAVLSLATVLIVLRLT